MIITLPWPPRELSPNARVHWAVRARKANGYRRGAAWLATAAHWRVFKASDRLSVTITFVPPDRRRRDADNLLASMKSGCDGLADAIGVDDSLWEITIRRAEPRKPGCVIVEVEPAREAAE